MKLVKEIRSKTGELHFKRWQIIKTPWFSLYLHNILKEDQDRHQHDHPWNISVLILWGGYWEESGNKLKFCRPGTVVKHKYNEFHKIKEILASTWSLALVSNPKHKWGYNTEQGWIDNKKYRELKRSGVWDEKP